MYGCGGAVASAIPSLWFVLFFPLYWVVSSTWAAPAPAVEVGKVEKMGGVRSPACTGGVPDAFKGFPGCLEGCLQEWMHIS